MQQFFCKHALPTSLILQQRGCQEQPGLSIFVQCQLHQQTSLEICNGHHCSYLQILPMLACGALFAAGKGASKSCMSFGIEVREQLICHCWLQGVPGSPTASSPKGNSSGRGSPPLRRGMSMAPPLAVYIGTKEANIFQVEYNQQVGKPFTLQTIPCNELM